MLQVRQTRIECGGVHFVRTTLSDGTDRAWPYVEIEPVDDSLPVLITRIGVRTYRLEYWYASSCNNAQFVTYNVRSEERAIQLAATRCRKLGPAECIGYKRFAD